MSVNLPEDTLLAQLTALLNATVTINVGVVAQLTRQEYITPYINEANFQQFVPLIVFNIVRDTLDISNTLDISFTSNDIYVANDWVILNQVI